MEISISKQQLALLPVEHYGGTITVIDNMAAVGTAVATLRQAGLIGFDTETRPSFKKGQTYSVSLLQLSSDNECFLFRLNKIGLPDQLKELLEDETVTKIGLSLKDDFRNLHKNYGFEPGGFIDLQDFSSKWHISDKSLTKMYGILFGKRISKSQRLSNWEAEQLAEAQQHYAALDAHACVRIYSYLKNGEFHPETSQYKITEQNAEI